MRYMRENRYIIFTVHWINKYMYMWYIRFYLSGRWNEVTKQVENLIDIYYTLKNYFLKENFGAYFIYYLLKIPYLTSLLQNNYNLVKKYFLRSTTLLN